MLKGEMIKGYLILQDFTTAGGGLSKWTFAAKNGKEYFFKEFLSPKYPTRNAPGSKESKAKKKEICEQFEKHHKNLMKKINDKCGMGGNLVYSVDFFRNESKYYKVTEKVDVASLRISEIASLPLKNRLLILKTIAHSLQVLHSAEVVHGDLKPDNILIKHTKTGNYTAKLIDFDNSFFSGQPPELSEDLVGDMVYYSPEMMLYIKQNKKISSADLTTKSDIFALGLLFSLYLTGDLPLFLSEKYPYACMAVVAGQKLQFNAVQLPEELLHLMQKMLQGEYTSRPDIHEVFETLRNLNLDKYEEDTFPPAKLKGTVQPVQNTASQTGNLKGKGLNILKKSD